jgi:hypothetical protein
MVFKIYDTSKIEDDKLIYDIRITFEDKVLNYYNLKPHEYTSVLAAFKILEKHKYKEDK